MASSSEGCRPHSIVHAFSGITATDSVEVNCLHATLLWVMHHISGATGGYVSIKHRSKSSAQAANEATYGNGDAVAITSLTRATNVVTVVTAAAHGMVTGNKVVVRGPKGSQTFDGEFAIASVADTTHLTYAQTASDEVALGGYCSEIVEVSPPTTGGRNNNIKTSNTATSYTSIFADPSPYVMLTCNVGAGTHHVSVQAMNA